MEYKLERRTEERQVPNATVHYMCYVIRADLDSHYLDVPCKSTLHHLITGLFYNFDWYDERDKDISEDDFLILKHIFSSQKEYNLWKDAMKKLKEEGVDIAKSYLIDRIKLLALRKVMSGKL